MLVITTGRRAKRRHRWVGIYGGTLWKSWILVCFFDEREVGRSSVGRSSAELQYWGRGWQFEENMTYAAVTYEDIVKVSHKGPI